MMGFFDFGRIEGYPTRYLPKKSPVTLDVTETIIIVFFIVLGLSYFFIVPSYTKRRSIYVGVKTTFSVLIGCLIMVENFGQEWEIGAVRTKVPYRAGQEYDIQSSIGIKIGLRSVNITLQGKGEEGTPLANEIINYNERFWWTWDQGRFGFGPYSGLLQRSFRDAQRKGLPIPILWIAEYFIIDGEGIRYGRFYRTAGWYCHILLWSAFAGWVLANIFLQAVGRYAACLIAITGILQLLTCIIWISVHNPTPLVIPFEDGVLRVQLGPHFWMTTVCGTLCIVLAVVIMFLDLRYPSALSTFLGTDPLNQYDEYIVRYSELKEIMRNKGDVKNAMQMTDVSDNSQARKDESMVVLRRRSTIKTAQKSLYRSPVPMKIENEDEAIYENQIPARSSGTKMHKRSDETDDYRPPVPKKVKRIKVVH